MLTVRKFLMRTKLHNGIHSLDDAAGTAAA